MYADDAIIFLKPTKRDVANLKDLLARFGQVTGLSTNIQKTSITPISCDGMDLDDILSDFPATRLSFPIKYLGLPLTVRRLRRLDFQPLVDRAASKMSTWNGRNLTQAGRVTLVKSVLSSQPVYLMTALKPPKETLDEVDTMRKRFLWAGDKELTGGKCKINWTRTTLPKEYGGLGILNLQKFARALRLRWLWHEWTAPDKAWVGTGTPCDDTDRLLFRACTMITVGNGHKTRFWWDAWVQGTRPKDIAPGLFARTMNKNKTVTVAMEITNGFRILTIIVDLMCHCYAS